MVNTMLVAGSLKSIVDILEANGILYVIEDSDACKAVMEEWEKSEDKELSLRQARPAMKRILSREPYVFETDGEPLMIRVNDEERKLHVDSFGEILLERADKNWRISFSIKSDAEVLSSMPVADRDSSKEGEKEVVYNEIDDFGDRIFGVPCSNEYFDDVNAILEKITDHDREAWRRHLSDENFVYDRMITPMLKAMGDEITRICADHPETPQRLIDYFYGKYDYYFISPIDELKLTRIGAVNARKGLGRIPDNDNHYTACVDFPKKLLDVRFATGKLGEISNDTLQLSFDRGWSVCITMRPIETRKYGRLFYLNVYLPVTPFGSYRDQVAWDN